MKCKYCKKELENKNIVEITINKGVIWSDDKEIIVEGKGGERYYCHLNCLNKLIRKGRKIKKERMKEIEYLETFKKGYEKLAEENFRLKEIKSQMEKKK